MHCMFAVLLILKHKTMTTRSNEEIEARKAENTRNLIKHYTEELTRENLRPSSRRYYSDMIIALSDDQDNGEKKREINAFWNDIEAKRDADNNKIEFLQETIEYLRELVVEVSNPENSMIRRNAIVREVKNKGFYGHIRGRINERIRDERDREAAAIAKKDAEYNDKLKEALKRIS